MQHRVIDKPTNIKNSNARKAYLNYFDEKADIYRSSKPSKLIFMLTVVFTRTEFSGNKDGEVFAFEKFSLKIGSFVS